MSFGADNWIGQHVRISENVRFGNCVQVDDGVVIGANAQIQDPVRLIGEVPENAEVAGDAVRRNTARNGQDGCPYAIGIPAFTISKNESIRERQATPRKPLASALHIDGELQDQAPAGAQRKRGADPVIGPEAKRICTGLESRYRNAEGGPSPARATGLPETGAQDVAAHPPPVPGKAAFAAFQTTATGWLDRQDPARRPPATASAPAPAVVPDAPKPSPDRDAQRRAWHTSVLSKENQNALERAMRQSIRIPAAVAGGKTPRPLPDAEQAVFRPLYNGKAPML